MPSHHVDDVGNQEAAHGGYALLHASIKNSFAVLKALTEPGTCLCLGICYPFLVKAESPQVVFALPDN